MKRLAVIALGLLVLLANTGFTLRVHYCMGDLVGASIIGNGDQEEVHECPKCGMKRSASRNDCCKDEKVEVKASDHAVLTHALYFAEATFSALPQKATYSGGYRAGHTVNKHTIFFKTHGPLMPSGPPLFIRYGVFRI